MKKIIYTGLFLIFAAKLFSAEFSFFPVRPYLKGIAYGNNMFISYGSTGSILFSYDNGESWEQTRSFTSGNIVKVFIDSTSIMAVDDSGRVFTSSDTCRSWQNVLNIGDSLFAIIKYPEGYFVRTENHLLTLTDSFTVSKKIDFYSKPLQSYLDHQYNFSIADFKHYLIAEIDSSKIIRFNYQLFPVDTIDLFSLGLANNLNSRYLIHCDSSFCCFRTDDVIYKTEDFIKFDTLLNIPSTINPVNYKLFNEDLYTVSYNTMTNNFTMELFKVVSSDSLQSLGYLKMIKLHTHIS